MPATVSRFLDPELSHADLSPVRRHVVLCEFRQYPKLAADANLAQGKCDCQNSVASNPSCIDCSHPKDSCCKEESTLVG